MQRFVIDWKKSEEPEGNKNKIRKGLSIFFFHRPYLHLSPSFIQAIASIRRDFVILRCFLFVADFFYIR